jgi:hypothetical protein
MEVKKDEHEERFVKILTADLSADARSRWMTLMVISVILTIVAVVAFYGVKKMRKAEVGGDKAEKDGEKKASPKVKKAEDAVAITGSK